MLAAEIIFPNLISVLCTWRLGQLDAELHPRATHGAGNRAVSAACKGAAVNWFQRTSRALTSVFCIQMDKCGEIYGFV